MPSYSETWDVTKPAGSRDLALGDDDIRELKRAIDERLNEDHIKPNDETGYTTVGYHRKVTLIEQASNPAAVTDGGILYTKDDSGDTELYFIDDSGNVIQLTQDGKIKFSSLGNVTNNTFFKAVNNAGNGTVDLIKANASDVTVINDGAQLETSAAPTDDAGIANKKYVDDQIAAIPDQVGFAAKVSKSAGTIYQAATDGIVFGFVTNAGAGVDYYMYSDSSSSPSTVVAHPQFGSTTSIAIPFCFPVKKNDYYQVATGTGTLSAYYFIPLGP